MDSIKNIVIILLMWSLLFQQYEDGEKSLVLVLNG